VFVLGKPFQTRLMFASKHGTYLIEALIRFYTLRSGFLPYPHLTRLEKLAKEKHSNLLQKFVNYGQKVFITLGPGWKLMSVTNTLAYYCRQLITSVKSFMI
jgi:hypothetical protein